jgi:hypothetical protein
MTTAAAAVLVIVALVAGAGRLWFERRRRPRGLVFDPRVWTARR